MYNNNTDGAEPVLLFSKEGRTVTSSTDFPGFYNMDLTIAPPFITITEKGEKGGSKRKTYRRTYKKNKRSKTKRRKLRRLK